MNLQFTSLRQRILLPTLLAAAMVALVVAIASYLAAHNFASQESQSRFAAIRRVVEESSFPLTGNVLNLLSSLTGAHWMTVDPQGTVIEYSTGSPAALMQNGISTSQMKNKEITSLRISDHPEYLRLEGVDYQVMRIKALKTRNASATNHEVIVLANDLQRKKILYQAAATPLLTGFSTILLLTSITWFLTERLISRIHRLQVQVENIAAGDFSVRIPPSSKDELGSLANSVGFMTEQLQSMWQALRQRHGQELLHQISSGLAHNLRNTLTGARMAVELVQRQLTRQARSLASKQALDTVSNAEVLGQAQQGLASSSEQMEQAESYVQRLLLASRGQQTLAQPAPIRDCLEGIRHGLQTSAQHRDIALDWTYADDLRHQSVSDGPTLVSAVSNLVWNALEAGKHVSVHASITESNVCQIQVSDDGPGPDPNVLQNMFAPFVSTKPEGLGLGLSVVRRSAETLQGDVQWTRIKDRTIFSFHFPTHPTEIAK